MTSRGMSLSPKGYAMTEKPMAVYRNAGGLTNAVKIFLTLHALLTLAGIVSGYMTHGTLLDIQNGAFASDAQMDAAANAADLRDMIVGLSSAGIAIVSLIIFLVWVYRASYNARQLGADGMEISPGWSVGWFFIPIANLWKPFQAMQEIWQASHSPSNWRNESTGLVPYWWALLLISSIAGKFASRASLRAEEIDEIISANLFVQGTEILSLIYTIVTFMLVTKIYAAQQRNLVGNSF